MYITFKVWQDIPFKADMHIDYIVVLDKLLGFNIYKMLFNKDYKNTQ